MLDESLEKMSFARANLIGANLKDARLRAANLESANFLNANLEQAYFRNTNLIRANLCGAFLDEANFSGADLLGADLKDAALIWTNDSTYQHTFFVYRDAIFAEQTILPDGSKWTSNRDMRDFTHPEEWKAEQAAKQQVDP